MVRRVPRAARPFDGGSVPLAKPPATSAGGVVRAGVTELSPDPSGPNSVPKRSAILTAAFLLPKQLY